MSFYTNNNIYFSLLYFEHVKPTKSIENGNKEYLKLQNYKIQVKNKTTIKHY